MALVAAAAWRLPRRVWLLVGLLAIACSLLTARLMAQPPAPGAGVTTQPATQLATLPGAARLSISRALGAAEPQFRVARRGAGLTGSGGGLQTHFAIGGAAVSVGSTAVLRLGLAAIGRGDTLHPLPSVTPTARANVVTYQRPGVSESYASGPLGLEQVFTLSSRSVGAGALSLVVGMVPRGVDALLASHGTTLTLTDDSGRILARYGDLRVTDANGRVVPARIVLDGRRLLLRVSDQGARYPLRIDPFTFDQVAELTPPSNFLPEGGFGAVAISADGNTIVVGVPGYGAVGAAFVFAKSASSGWQNATQQALLLGPSTSYADFGTSVAVSANGNTIVAGADGPGAGSAGAAYVFNEPSGGWGQAPSSRNYAAELTPSDPSNLPHFGWAVGISANGQRVFVGAPFQTNGDIGDQSNADSGRVYIFTEPSTGWASTAVKTGVYAGGTGVGGNSSDFGMALAVSANDTLIVGAPDFQQAPDTGNNGAAYVYPPQTVASGGGSYFPLTVPDQQDQNPGFCTEADFGESDFGTSVAVSNNGTIIAVGAICASADNLESGVVYEFTEPAGGHWVTLTSPGAVITDGLNSATNNTSGGGLELGNAVAVSGSGDTIIAADSSAQGGAGAVFAFQKGAHGWGDFTGDGQVLNDNPSQATSSSYGTGVALSADGNTAVVSAAGDDNGLGAAYVFHSDSTATTVACSPSALRPHWQTRCLATVSSTGGGGQPGGQVAFSVRPTGGSFAPGRCTLSPLAGHSTQATCYVTFTAAGNGIDTVTASYAGEPTGAGLGPLARVASGGTYESSSGTTKVTVEKNAKHPTRMTVKCVPNPVKIGFLTTCIATVSGLLSGAPPEVAFSSNPGGKWEGESCSTAAGTTGFNVETCKSKFGPDGPGPYKITGKFAGDNGDLPSHATTKLQSG